MRSPRLQLISAVICACTIAASSVGRAEDQAAIDPQVRKVFDDFATFLKGLKGFEVSIDVAMQIEQNGDSNKVEFEQKLHAQRPNKLSFTLEASAGGGAIVCDGKEMSIYLKSFGKYLTEECAETLDGVFQNPLAVGVMSPGNATIVTMALLAEDPAAKLLERAESARYGGVVMLDDTKCHLISVSGKELDWQVWIEAGDKPLVRQFVPDVTKFLKKAQQGAGTLPWRIRKSPMSSSTRIGNWTRSLPPTPSTSRRSTAP